MRDLCRDGPAEAGADCFAHDGISADADSHTHLGTVEESGLARLPVRPDAPRAERLAVPAIVAKDPICPGHDLPALKVAECAALTRTRFHVAVVSATRPGTSVVWK